MVLTAHTRGNRFVPAHKSPTGGTQRPGEGPLARATPTAEPLSPPREPMIVLLAGVSIAALAPDAEETSQSQQAQFPTTEIFSHIEIADGRVWMLPKGVDYFVGDLSDQKKTVAWATHALPAADQFGLRLLDVGQDFGSYGCRIARPERWPRGLARLWPLGTITDVAVPLLYLIFRQLVAWLGSPSYHRPSHGTRAAPIVPAAWPRRIRRGVTGASTVNLLAWFTRLRPAMAPPGDKSWPPKHDLFCVDTLLGQRLYILLFVEHATCRVHLSTGY